MCVYAVSDNTVLQLYLRHDFLDISKIKHIICITSDSAPTTTP